VINLLLHHLNNELLQEGDDSAIKGVRQDREMQRRGMIDVDDSPHGEGAARRERK